MTGESNWIPIVMVLGGGLAILAFAWGSSLRYRYLRSQKVHKACPASGKEVVYEPVQDTRTGVWTGVQSCTAFDNPSDVHCAKSCLKDLEAAAIELPDASEGHRGRFASMKA